MRRHLLIISLLVLGICAHAQRGPVTAQYLLHPALVNPAAISIRSGMSGGFVYQRQWVGFDGSPTTFYANFNAPLKNKNSFVGGTVVGDQISVHSRYKVFGIYAHKFQLDNGSYLSLGVSPGLDIFQSNYSESTSDFENDPILSYANQSLVSFNSGFGVNYYNKRLWLGFAIPQLMHNYFEGSGDASNIALSFSQMTYQFIAGWKKDIGKFITFKPSTMVRYSPASPIQFDLNAMFEYREEIGLGVAYRTTNALNFMANYRISRDFRLGYAFSTQLGGELTNYHSGTHEVALVYGVGNNRKANINLPKKIQKYRKKKTKEIKKALKEAQKKKEKEAKQKEKEQTPLNPGNTKKSKQPYS